MRLWLQGRDRRGAIALMQRPAGDAAATGPETHTGTVMPGYTHLQRAQPVLLAHHLLAYF